VAAASGRLRAAGRADEAILIEATIELASNYARYGYRPICLMLRDLGWEISVARIEGTCRAVGVKVPQEQPEQRRLCLNDGSYIRLRPFWPNQV
jgi:hypothetical protein